MDIDKGPHLKIQVQDLLPQFFIDRLFHDPLHFRQQIHQFECNVRHAAQDLVIFTFPLQLQEQLIDVPKPSCQLSVQDPDFFPQFQEILLIQRRAVHLPPAFHQIVGLIDEEYIIPAAAL